MSVALSTARAPVLERSSTLVGFEDATARMRSEISAIRAEAAQERVWFLEHPPLYTAGTSSRPEDLTDGGRFPNFVAGRGGQWTYHGPGQRVAYIMLDLSHPHGTVAARDVHGYVAGLEAWLIAALASLGVRGERRQGRVGLWVSRPDPVSGEPREDKIAAIGVRVTRWVTWHGVSLNVSPDLEHFSGIVPCGIRDHGVTSLRALGCDASMREVDDALAECWGPVFGAPFNLPP